MRKDLHSMPYMNQSLPVRARLEDLLSRMTLNQKIRQLSSVVVQKEYDERIFSDGVGGIASFAEFDSAQALGHHNRSIQKAVVERNEWGIPALFHTEGICGVPNGDFTVFPAPISVGACFCPEIAEEIGKSVSDQMLSAGFHQVLAPVLDLARDFRWGRTNECFGGDPVLAAILGSSFTAGLQGENGCNGTASTAKHFIGYSIPEAGLNLARCMTDARDIRENFAKPFEAAIRISGLKSVMASYSEINGRPVGISSDILTRLLRDELGFTGLAVSDYMLLEMLKPVYRIFENSSDAGSAALRAGLDMELPRPFAYSPELREDVKRGVVEESLVDRAAARVLGLKFELGLFDAEVRDSSPIDTGAQRILSQKVAEMSLVLLKNEKVLPVTDLDTRIAVVGPVGDSIRLLNGTYTRVVTGTGIRDEGESIFESLRKIYPRTVFEGGCGITGEDRSGFYSAIKAAEKADLVVLTLGGKNGWRAGCTSGEGNDSDDIRLPGAQEELALEIFKANRNIVLVHTDGRPLVSPVLYEKLPAVIEAWLPGPYGGRAVARVIAGIVCPGGRLPVDIPRNVGQTPLYFGSRQPSDEQRRQVPSPEYAGSKSTSAQYPFGFGLSYTTFSYGEAGLTEKKAQDGIPVISISLEIKNTGTCGGDEVVQLYGADEFASVVRPQKELMGFIRIPIKPGESKRIVFTFRLDQLAFPDESDEWKLERGDFRFSVCSDSGEIKCSLSYRLAESRAVNPRVRGLFAGAIAI